MKKLALVLVAMVMAQCAMAQELQFSLPIMPEKMWPSDYANYEADVRPHVRTGADTLHRA